MYCADWHRFWVYLDFMQYCMTDCRLV